MPIVRALPILESGRAVLELRNGFNQAVAVKNILFSAGAQASSARALLENPVELEPGESKYVDITEKLEPLFDADNPAPQQKTIKILLTLEPEPPAQPQPADYRIGYEGGRLMEFASQ